jgi:hypothetical protein
MFTCLNQLLVEGHAADLAEQARQARLARLVRTEEPSWSQPRNAVARLLLTLALRLDDRIGPMAVRASSPTSEA